MCSSKRSIRRSSKYGADSPTKPANRRRSVDDHAEASAPPMGFERLLGETEVALSLLDALPLVSLANRVLALCQLGLCGPLELAGGALRPELK